ncbi:MAG: ABC transporter permease subunit, partial [Acidimicrobiia bacterium]
MTTPRVSADLLPPEPPPEASQPGAVVWLRKNLFGSVASTIVSVVLGVALFFMLRGLLAYLFSDERLWEVIPRNATNYAIEGYPRPNITRIWVSLDIILFLAGVSMAVWKPSGMMSLASLAATVRSIGTVLVLVGVLAPDTFESRFTVGVVGLVLIGLSFLGMRLSDRAALADRIPTLALIAGGAVLFLAVLWLLPLASTTQIPWTVGVGVAVIGHLVGRVLAARVASGPLRAIVTAVWLVSLPVIYLHIQRNPEVDWDTVIGSWLPWIAGIVVVGVALINLVSRSDRERAGVINALIVIAAVLVWTVDAPMVARALLLLLAVLSLATPTFGSSALGRRNMALTWLAGAAFFSYIFVIGDAGTGLETRNEYYGGLNLTMMLAAGGLLLSFPLGVLLALGRTSTMPIFRLLSTAYIEVVRGVPLITVLFIARFGILNFLP